MIFRAIFFTRFRTCTKYIDIKLEDGETLKHSICNNNTLGDEYHYTMESQACLVCNKLFNENFLSNVNTYKLTNLINTTYII